MTWQTAFGVAEVEVHRVEGEPGRTWLREGENARGLRVDAGVPDGARNIAAPEQVAAVPGQEPTWPGAFSGGARGASPSHEKALSRGARGARPSHERAFSGGARGARPSHKTTGRPWLRAPVDIDQQHPDPVGETVLHRVRPAVRHPTVAIELLVQLRTSFGFTGHRLGPEWRGRLRRRSGSRPRGIPNPSTRRSSGCGRGRRSRAAGIVPCGSRW